MWDCDICKGVDHPTGKCRYSQIIGWHGNQDSQHGGGGLGGNGTGGFAAAGLANRGRGRGFSGQQRGGGLGGRGNGRGFGRARGARRF